MSDQKFKIGNGPPTTMCTSYTQSVVVETGHLDKKIYCRYIRLWLESNVTQCSGYEDAHHPSEYEMKKIAWLLDPSRRQIGFDTSAFVKPGTDLHRKLRREGSDYDPD